MLLNRWIFLLIFLSKGLLFAENNLPELEKKINQIVEKKALVDLQLSSLQDSIKLVESDIRSKRKLLVQRARALSFLKDFKWGGLLAADDPNAFERNLIIMNRLNKYDAQLFKEYRNSLKNLFILRKDLKTKKSDLDFVENQLKQQEVKILLAEENINKRNIVDKKESLLLYKGKLSPPIHRPVVQNFGSKRDNSNQYALIVRGLIFSSNTGDHIQAVGPGKVIFSDQVPHWGDAIIVQHPDNYYSVYAGLSKVNKVINEQVQQSDVIAEAGNQSLYFELRHFDQPVNPKKWFTRNMEVKDLK